MKIVGLTPSNQSTGETPEQMFLRKLRDRGHEVIIADKLVHIPKDTDVVVAMSEVTCENAYNLSQKHNVPFYAHMEWIPPWRVFYDPESKWGFKDGDISYSVKMNHVRRYQDYISYWSMADIKTLAADCFHQQTKEFMGRDAVIYTKYLGIDTEKLKKYLDDNDFCFKDGSVTCVARFVPHKRIHHVISALNLMDFSGTLNLVGYGTCHKQYEEYIISFNINYVDSKYKYETMRKSKVVVALWSGMVPAEAAYLGTPCITYSSPYMIELYGGKIDYAFNNDIDSLKNMLHHALKRSKEEDSELCKQTVDAIENGEINTLTQEKAIDLLESLIKKAAGEKK